MPKTPPPKTEKDQVRNAEFFKQVKSDYRWKIFGQSAFITLASIFIFGAVGYGIDYLIGKGHMFMIILLVISYPVTQISLYKKLKDFNPHKK